MERGGTITWYLNADDSNFQKTVLKVRQEAKLTADDVDRSFKRGFKNAGSSIDGMSGKLKNFSSSTANLKTNLIQDIIPADGLKSRASSLASSVNQVENSLNSLSAVANVTKPNIDALFPLTSTRRKPSISQDTESAKLSLDDFYSDLSRAANHFRSFQIALRGLELTSFIVGTTLAAGAVIELVSALASLSGLVFAVPSAIASVAGVFGTFKVATLGVGDAFKQLEKPSSAAANSLKKNEDLTRRLTTLNRDYSETLQELAEERMRVLNEQIIKGTEAWKSISSAASDYLDISQSLSDLSIDVANAQFNLNATLAAYGENSQEAITASRNLFAAQGKLYSANAQLDTQYSTIKESVRDLATNLDSLRKADKNQIQASLQNLKALRLDKKARGENVDEISRMVDLLEGLSNIKDTKLTINPDLEGAQRSLNALKAQFPDIAVAAAQGASKTEESLTKSLRNISEQIDEVNRQRAEIASPVSGAKDPFKDLSSNAKSFVLALKDVKNSLMPVIQIIQDRFFDGLDVELRNVASTGMPIFRDGLSDIATAINGVIKEAARVVQQPFFTGALAKSMKNTADSTDILRGAVEPAAESIANLINLGNPYVKMLAEWIVKQLQLTAAFTGSAQGQQKLKDAIDNGISSLKLLGDLLGSVGGLLFDLFKVSDQAGMSLISTITGIVDNMRAYIGTAAGQEKLKALFEATSTIVSALAGAIGVAIDKILDLVKAYNDLDDGTKKIVTNILVFAAVATPVLTYVSSLAASFGASLLGLREVLQLVGVDTTKLTKNLGKLGNVFNILTKNPLLVVISALVGLFVYLGTQTDIFKNAISALEPVLKTAGESLKPIMDVIGQLVVQLGQALAPLIPVIADAFGKILVALLPLVPIFIQLTIQLLPIFVATLQLVVNIIKVLVPIISVLVQIFATVLVAAINATIAVFRVVASVVGAAANVFVNAWNVIRQAWNSAIDFFKNLPGNIKNALGNVGEILLDAGKKIIEGLLNGLKDGFNKVKDFLKDVTDSFPKIKGPPKRDASLLFNAGQLIMQGLKNGLEDQYDGIRKSLGVFSNSLQDSISPIDGGDITLGSTASSASMAPSVANQEGQPSSIASGVNINQTNNIYNDVDMQQGLRDLAWQLGN